MPSEPTHPSLSPIRLDAIQQWQKQTQTEQETATIIASLYENVLHGLKILFQEVQTDTSATQSSRLLEESIATLFFWGQDFQVPEGSLDSALRFSHRLRDTVLLILISLGESLHYGMIT